jgi:hypothetical protein
MKTGTTITIIRRPGRALVASAALAGLVLLSACSSTASSGTAAAPTPVAKTTTSSSTAGAPGAAPAAVQKVNANTASRDEVQKALETNGVPNASRWAREVEEYRPYPTDDPNMGKLRQNLAKYNPGPGVVDQIVASLSL